MGLKWLAKHGVCLIEPVFHNGRVVDIGGVAWPHDDNLVAWKAVLRAPLGSSFQHELFVVELRVPTDYPGLVPPMVFFMDPIPPHPNIHPVTGAVNLDILDNKWSPAIRLPVVLLCVRVLLGAPDFGDFCFASAFKQTHRLSRLKDAVAVYGARRHKLGHYYVWLGTCAPFNILPNEVWLQVLLPMLVPQPALLTMSELATAAGVAPETLAVVCAAEERNLPIYHSRDR